VLELGGVLEEVMDVTVGLGPHSCGPGVEALQLGLDVQALGAGEVSGADEIQAGKVTDVAGGLGRSRSLGDGFGWLGQQRLGFLVMEQARKARGPHGQ
jgi:hypothetical protein